ncbi:MFS general substrate transporter [Aspergillus granulosus]|uniref:MFS general substrate transporter n=1 Tax=Aspergillus granulosus TaxID=176169 RepID=A0ABR4H703_9EURO
MSVAPLNKEPADKDASVLDDGPQLPPEEGRRGWLCVIGAFAGLFGSFGFLNAIGIFQTTYKTDILRHYTPSDIAWIFAVQLCLMWAPGPLYGRLIDTYGAGPVLYPCSLLCVFSLCMTSLADQYYQIFLAQGLGFGIGAGGVFTTCFVCVGQWFVRRRGLGIGIATSGSSLGGVIFPLFFDKVMGEVGFYGAVRYTALLIGILLGIACFLIQGRLPRKKWNHEARWFDINLLKQRQFALYVLGTYLVMWGLWAPFDFISSMAKVTGFSDTLALYLISILSAASVPGRIIPPWLSDRLGHFNMITLSSFGMGASMLALWLPFNYHYSHAGLFVFSGVYGFFSGAVISLLMPCVAKAGTIETLGQRFGTFQIIISISSLTGLPIMGAILDRQHNTDFLGLQLFSSISVLLGFAFLVVATCLLSRAQGTWKV